MVEKSIHRRIQRRDLIRPAYQYGNGQERVAENHIHNWYVRNSRRSNAVALVDGLQSFLIVAPCLPVGDRV